MGLMFKSNFRAGRAIALPFLFLGLSNVAVAAPSDVKAVKLPETPARAAQREKGEVCETQTIMTLPWTICLVDAKKNEADLKAYIAEGMKELRYIDSWMSEWKENSPVSEINRQAGVKPVKVDSALMNAIELSLAEAERSGGNFDITFNAFFGKYSWKKGAERFPTEQEIKATLPLVNFRNVIVDKKASTVFLKVKGMKIGLGGMGEGWAIDKVYDIMKAHGVAAGYIDASGGVRVWGVKPSGKLWTIGVGNPRPMNPDMTRKTTLFNLYATDIAIATAGDTEKYFEKDGKRYHHIIDPKTGYSAQGSIQVTTICKTAVYCDLVDDSIYIDGPVKGREYAEKNGVSAVIIAPDKSVVLTSGLTVKQTEWGQALFLNPPYELR